MLACALDRYYTGKLPGRSAESRSVLRCRKKTSVISGWGFHSNDSPLRLFPSSSHRHTRESDLQCDFTAWKFIETSWEGFEGKHFYIFLSRWSHKSASRACMRCHKTAAEKKPQRGTFLNWEALSSYAKAFSNSAESDEEIFSCAYIAIVRLLP